MKTGNRVPHLLITLFALAFPCAVFSQAGPSLIWSRNVGARLFAVDAQTNVYAASGGNVIVLTGAGIPVQTNATCPLPGVAQRDASGNYYFGGNFDGTQDFGGITLVGGWTNWPSPGKWAAGWPTCFLGKYASDGRLQWVISFGRQSYSNALTDLIVDASANCMAGYASSAGQGRIVRCTSSGLMQWDTAVTSNPQPFAISLGGLTSSNVAYFLFRTDYISPGGRIDFAGNFAWIDTYPLRYWAADITNSKPLIDDLAQVFQVGRCFSVEEPNCTNQVLRKCAVGGGQIWSQSVSPGSEWLLARDGQSAVYCGGTNGALIKYDNDATLIWSNNFGNKCYAMIVDSS